MRDHVMQFAGNAGPFPAGCVLEQGTGEGLRGGGLLNRHAAGLERCPGAGGQRAKTRRQDGQHGPS